MHNQKVRLKSETFYRPQNEVWGKVIFSQASVCPQVMCLWVGGGWGQGVPLGPGDVPLGQEGCLPLGLGVYTPRTHTHTWTHPIGYPFMVNKRAVRILLECFLVFGVFPQNQCWRHLSSRSLFILWVYLHWRKAKTKVKFSFDLCRHWV